jgi:pimeloyl-ACP methyl ester carboxylesterase
LLADPAAHGGDPGDSFTVVLPTLPGYGFSAQPAVGELRADQCGRLWHRLMTEGLGFDRYVAHGSDVGAWVVRAMTRLYPRAPAAIHLATPGFPVPALPRTPVEQAYAADVESWFATEGSYSHQHATKPATIGAALLDSPAGLAAWISEKVWAWSSVDAEQRPKFSRDLLLANLTLYWTTGTIATSMLPYWSMRRSAASPGADRSPVPAAITVFGGERIRVPKPRREVAERTLTVADWREYDRGGHFPALSEPVLFAQSLRDAFRRFR